MKKATVIGHLGIGHVCLDGQTVKTKIITNELQRQLGEDQVLTIDTYGGAKTLLKSPAQVFRALRTSGNVLIFPAQNGLRVYAPLLSVLRQFFKNRKLHYVVIGGWLPEFLKKRKLLGRILKKFDGIYVETNTMKEALDAQGFGNVFIMPNCKNLTVLSKEELVYPQGTPYKLCTFSRVMKEKGIEDAVSAVEAVNLELGYQAFCLDIYGQVDAGQTQWFDELQQTFPPYIRYRGLVPFDESTEVLKNYFALLFPTRFYTEGIPGTIIDAYAAGIPVISARWESCADIVDEGITGIGYDFGSTDQLKSIMFNMPNTILEMKESCIGKAKTYHPETAIRVLIKKLEGD